MRPTWPPDIREILRKQLYNSGFTKRGGYIVCTYFDENFLNLVPAAHVEGLYSCLDYYQNVSDPFSKNLINQYNRLYPGDAKFTAGSACTGLYRGLRLWEAAVKEAGSLKQDDVIKALDHAKIAGEPGGPAEMVPGQHHVRMNMYIAQASNGIFKIVKSLGVIDPKEANVPGLADAGRMRAAV
jgi:urea transport system substrate-binding protein